ncbi:aminotransferase class I/II-fold pyridoxal phosphate-dependent enzyme [Tumebacillus sp. ITR2]|uniref:Aminotransferase n=1 Tax=Tumebacillus amylolyticus TaxID=2801339 RepID=A0ABS1J7Q0_9BACL|nr:aminotransferase class I/II-fold pyridoxal phosphate-dependent enzyme [Tumebacillus amylolyticus]MBL0386316.1 aminotransferase class I/II-fold pyridoxal phosphate-dependent enzyme [Tumebacillus amylolyticus]
MKPADKLQYLTSSIFTEMANHKHRLMAQGRDVIDLGIGSPDLPPPEHVRQALADAVLAGNTYGYAHQQGFPTLRQAFSEWFKKRFHGVELDPATEVLTLMGSQDGLAHLPAALMNPGDVALIPDPSYPVYAAGLHLASVEVAPLPLLAKNGFMPDFDAIPQDVAEKAKMMLISYPGNPIPAMADESVYRQAIEFCKKHDIVLVHDLAYSELAFDGYRPMSILEIPGAKEVAVEFHSLSKSFSMAGCRIGFLAGRAEVVQALATLKSNIDYGVFGAIQTAATAALTGDQSYTREMSRVYQDRRDALIDGLGELGWEIEKPKATMFVWAKLPFEIPSMEFCLRLVEEANVVMIPGRAFGEQGEGYVRIALVQPVERLREVVRRIAESGILEPMRTK